MRTPKTSDWPSFRTQERGVPGGVGALLVTESEAHDAGAPPLLRGLNEREIADVMAAGTPKVLYRGATLFAQGSRNNGIYLIESGRIRVFYTAPSAREITLAYWHPGNFVGGPDVFGNGLHVWSGVAAANSSLLHLSGEALRCVIEKIPLLAINVIDGLSFKGRCYSGLAQMLGTRSATERLAHLLLHLSVLYGVEEKGGVLIAASFTHADIANMIGATRQWVTICLKRYAEAGIIGFYRSNLVIIKSALLAEIRDGQS